MRLIESFFHAWERRLAFRDDGQRRALPFDWGVEYLAAPRGAGSEPRWTLHRHVEDTMSSSASYFNPLEAPEVRVEGRQVFFTSPLVSPDVENNTVHGLLFPVRSKGPAVVVLPQWNARDGAHDGLCRLLNLYGVSALKLSLPYHGSRKPAGSARADYMLSPNLGRTLHACRQAVLETRVAVSWLIERGHRPVGVVGTSLGSCIAFIAFAHDDRICTGVFNHISSYFADVVWRGISTRHIRQGLEGRIGLEELRRIWLPISPQNYVHLLRRSDRWSLLVTARFDLAFPTDLSHLLVEELSRQGARFERFVLPCGHYTTAKFPFNLMDGLVIAGFLKRRLKE